jgi:hypothetical protein
MRIGLGTRKSTAVLCSVNCASLHGNRAVRRCAAGGLHQKGSANAPGQLVHLCRGCSPGW